MNTCRARDIIFTIFARLLLVFIGIIFFIPFIIVYCLPVSVRSSNWLVYRLSDWFYRMVLWGSLIPVTMRGTENLPNVPAIFVMNHQSSLDIPLGGVLARGHPHLWLARSELRESCVLRVLLSLFSEVIDVNSPISAMRSLIRIISNVKTTGQSIMIFPEGGRFTDGYVHDFFAGFVILAKKTGYPVIPIRIFGADKVYPPGTMIMRRVPVTVLIGKPFIFQEGDDDEEFKNRVQRWFSESMIPE